MAATTANTKPVRDRLSSLGGLVIVVTSSVLSAVSYGPLPDSVRIRWTIGTYHHYGPEYAPTLAVLVMLPVLVAGLYAGAYWLKTYLERTDGADDVDEFSALYDSCVLLVLGTVVVGQLVIIVFNL